MSCIYDNLPMLDSWYKTTTQVNEESFLQTAATSDCDSTTTTTLKKNKRIQPTTKVSFSNESPVVHHYEYVNEPIKRTRSTFVKSLFKRSSK